MVQPERKTRRSLSQVERMVTSAGRERLCLEENTGKPGKLGMVHFLV